MRLIDADAAITKERLARYPMFGRSRADITDLQEFLDECETVSIDPLPNDPLTLDELREMDGEPLWVVPLDKEPDWKPCWVICMEDYVLVDSTTNERRVYFLRKNEDYSKTWLAYRCEPFEWK